MSLKEMTRLNAALNALYMEQDDIYSAYAAHFGLSDTAFWVLYAVCESSEVKTQNALAETLSLPRQSINSAVAALVKRGYIALEQLPGARSGKALRLTDTGKALCDRVIYPLFAIESRALDALGADAERYVELTRRMIAALGDGVANAIK